MYYMAINKFKKGVEKEAIGRVIPGHIAWIKEMISGGTMVQAGKWGPDAGMSIIKAESLEEAEALILKDPLVSSGLVNHELGEFHPEVKL